MLIAASYIGFLTLKFSISFFFVDFSSADFSSGKHVIEQLLQLPVERREVLFLVSEEVLNRCSIRGKLCDCTFSVPPFICLLNGTFVF